MDKGCNVIKNYEKPKYSYTLTHAVFALLALALGTLWYKWFWEPMTLGGSHVFKTLFTALFALYTTIFFVKRKISFNKDALFMLAFSLIISLRFSVYYHDGYSLPFVLCVWVLHLSVLVYIRCMADGKTIDNIVGESARAVFVKPFVNFHTLFASLTAFFKFNDEDKGKEKIKKIKHESLLIILGIVIAVPIVCVVLSLLISDSFFENLLRLFGSLLYENGLDFNLLSYVNPITVLVAMYIYGAVFGADKKDDADKTGEEYRVAPATVIKTVLVSLITVYFIFAVAQFAGFAAMFNGVPPEGMTYADFARSGFFELCVVSCINGAVLFYSEILAVKKDEEKNPKLLKYLLIGFTLFLIATAASKMCLYISVYGFTPKRFYTLWFMALLAVIFIMSVFKQKNAGYRLSRFSVYVTCTFLIVLFCFDFEWLSVYLNRMHFTGAVIL